MLGAVASGVTPLDRYHGPLAGARTYEGLCPDRPANPTGGNGHSQKKSSIPEKARTIWELQAEFRTDAGGGSRQRPRQF